MSRRGVVGVVGGRDPSPEPETLEALLGRVALGDATAFERVYDATAGSVLGLARRVVRDPAQAEEVAQEVLLEVWRTASRFDPDRGTATTWILTMTHRRAVDRVRSAAASAARDDRVAAMEPTVSPDDPAQTVERRIEAERVRRALAQLTPRQRETVELSYYGGYTTREVAALLDLPQGTVKTRLRDGLIRLRDAMGVTDER